MVRQERERRRGTGHDFFFPFFHFFDFHALACLRGKLSPISCLLSLLSGCMKRVVLCFMGFSCSCERRFWGAVGGETDHRVFVRRKNSSYLVCYTVPYTTVARANMCGSSAFLCCFFGVVKIVVGASSLGFREHNAGSTRGDTNRGYVGRNM